MALVQCNASFSYQTAGGPRTIAAGELLDESDPAVAARRQFFTPTAAQQLVSYAELDSADLLANLDVTYARTADVQVFVAGGTWTKPAGAQRVHARQINGGSGAGSGRRGAAGTVRCGGGGGAAGAMSEAWFNAADLPATVAITVGAAGTGGAARTTDDTDGATGSPGGQSAFGSGLLRSTANGGGGGGTATAGTAAATGGGMFIGASAGAASGTGGVGGTSSASNTPGAGAGGAGGGISSGNAASNGGAGSIAVGFSNVGSAAGVVDTTQPVAGNTATANGSGGGGGGGASSITTAAQAGANGGFPGGGGGGGGASLNGNNSGKGGDGGAGVVVVTTFFSNPAESPGWVAWGDSLVAGAGAQTPWPTPLAGLLAVPLVAEGVGGETSLQIAARQGAMPAAVTVSGDTIPTSGGVTATTVSPAIPSSQGSQGWTGSVAGIRGLLSRSSGGTYTFTRFLAGDATSCPPGTSFIPDPGARFRAWYQIIWAGRNDGSSTAQAIAAIAAMVAYGQSDRFLVISVPNASGEGTGTGVHDYIVAMNATLAGIYGSQYIDIRSYLIASGLADAGITPTAQDLTDVSQDIVPTSLRIDNLHPTTAAHVLIAQQIKARMQSLGWA